MVDNGWDSVRRERLVKNELAFRDHNNRRVELEHQATAVVAEFEQEPVPFVCECGDSECITALTITLAEYEDAHSAPNRFTVKTGHANPDIERVVERHHHYWIVEKSPDELRPVS